MANKSDEVRKWWYHGMKWRFLMGCITTENIPLQSPPLTYISKEWLGSFCGFRSVGHHQQFLQKAKNTICHTKQICNFVLSKQNKYRLTRFFTHIKEQGPEASATAGFGPCHHTSIWKRYLQPLSWLQDASLPHRPRRCTKWIPIRDTTAGRWFSM